MKLPLVSVFIPCYNGERYLDAFLTSLYAQDYPRVEIIFVDDGSTDGTARIYRAYEQKLPEGWISKYVLQPHSGQAHAASLALSHLTGELFMWSDADDIMLPGSIGKKADFLISHDAFDMVRNDFYFYYDNADASRLVVGYGKNKSKGEDIFEGIFNSTMPCLAGTYMMRTELLYRCYPEKKMPLSDEGQNFQLLLPAASRSKCGFVDEKLMKYRIRSDSHSNRPRSISQQFQRIKGFYDLRLALLPYCECDRKAYEELALKIFENQKKDIILGVIAKKNKRKQE